MTASNLHFARKNETMFYQGDGRARTKTGHFIKKLSNNFPSRYIYVD